MAGAIFGVDRVDVSRNAGEAAQRLTRAKPPGERIGD
jgi:hypothetical protein